MAAKWQIHHIIIMYPGQYNICHYIFNTAAHVEDQDDDQKVTWGYPL